MHVCKTGRKGILIFKPEESLLASLEALTRSCFTRSTHLLDGSTRFMQGNAWPSVLAHPSQPKQMQKMDPDLQTLTLTSLMEARASCRDMRGPLSFPILPPNSGEASKLWAHGGSGLELMGGAITVCPARAVRTRSTSCEVLCVCV